GGGGEVGVGLEGIDGMEAIADILLLAMGRQVDFTALDLGAVGVAYDAEGIRVNADYQSSNRRLFACGDAIRSPATLNQRYGEVETAIHHALFNGPLWSNAWLSNVLLRSLNAWLQPSSPPRPSALPQVINVNPPLAYIGYSSAEARQRYGDTLTILRQSYQAMDQAQLLGAHYPLSTAGWCKLLVLDNGQIVGAYIGGVQSEEVIGAIALAMHHSIPMENLGQLCPPRPSITADLLEAFRLQWERARIKRQTLLFDWLEWVLNWQRDWTR
ncbi:MAG: NAD(P)/FAD-dependent oxidoreductase, partial [Moorea sp. SIO3C2]|nr:NAD(P)/FAD-dependent oxidoreductase [Moorena sp. SIO3C2]